MAQVVEWKGGQVGNIKCEYLINQNIRTVFSLMFLYKESNSPALDGGDYTVHKQKRKFHQLTSYLV